MNLVVTGRQYFWLTDLLLRYREVSLQVDACTVSVRYVFISGCVLAKDG